MINCEFWVAYKVGGKCKLGLYGGYPSPGVCQNCIKLGENNPEFARTLKERYKRSHPAGVSKISGCCDRADQD